MDSWLEPPRSCGVPTHMKLNASRCVPLLLDWFASKGRDLPWRRTTDPYAIWISEIMLQQTQVKTVIPYWERWMSQLPTVQRLAKAPEEQVLKLWEGLGYYSRARNLRAAAQQVVEVHHGTFPHRLEALLKLPGIGRYTAGAVASIAFNQPAPLLDGNVIRVFTRLAAMDGDPKSKELQERLWSQAQLWVQESNQLGLVHLARAGSAGTCSSLNQALMELGATVCTPKAPDCHLCPLQTHCKAFQMGKTEAFPQTAPRPVIQSRFLLVAVLERQGRYLLRKRPPGDVNAGFWEFPNQELAKKAAHPKEEAAQWLGLNPEELRYLTQVRHAITRYRFHLEVFHAHMRRNHSDLESGAEWVTPDALQDRALTAAHRRIARQLLGDVR